MVATCNSLGIMAVELAPTDALHGDLGVIKPVSDASTLSTSVYLPPYSMMPF